MRKTKQKIKLAVLFVEYNKEKYSASFEILKKSLEKQIKTEILYIIIDNSEEQKEMTFIANNIHRISGDNSFNEFSGWQKGLNYLGANNFNYEVILFITETFLQYDDVFLFSYAITAIKRCIRYGSMTGIIDKDKKRKELRLFDNHIKCWLRTSAFVLSKDYVPKFKLLWVDSNTLDKFIPEKYEPEKIQKPSDYFLADAPLSPQLKEKIIEWLSMKWYAAFDINEASWSFFRKKVKSLLNESMISIQAATIGCGIKWYASYHIVFYEKLKNKLRIIAKKFNIEF
ncbi:MAG: glycosyl transferase group 1 [Ignavibacteria bacterium]|nr:glycosyl transferase group 1 [Ignavibacteria bacterium]